MPPVPTHSACASQLVQRGLGKQSAELLREEDERGRVLGYQRDVQLTGEPGSQGTWGVAEGSAGGES